MSYVTIEMNGPGKNALGSDMFDFLQTSLAAADGAPVLLTGHGDAFSAGLNLREVAGFETPAQMEAFLRRLDDTCEALFDYPGPTVAHINGHAIAGGCILALCCDVRIGTPNPKTRVGLNEVPLGLAFPPKIMAIVKHRLDPRYVREVVLGGALASTERALTWGVLDAVSDDAIGVAHAEATRLARHSSVAYAASKAEIQWGVTSVDEAASSRFYRDLMPMWLSEDVKRQLRAALGR